MNVTSELDRRFRDAALREGLVDVRYDVVPSPLGELFLAATPRGLCRISYTVAGQDEVVAALVGRPRAARAVGLVMNRNPIPIVLPCHRVIGANGSLAGYAGGLDRKRRLLRLEGASLTV